MNYGQADHPGWKGSAKTMGAGDPRMFSGARQGVASSAKPASIVGGLDPAGLTVHATAHARDYVPCLFGGHLDRRLSR